MPTSASQLAPPCVYGLNYTKRDQSAKAAGNLISKSLCKPRLLQPGGRRHLLRGDPHEGDLIYQGYEPRRSVTSVWILALGPGGGEVYWCNAQIRAQSGVSPAPSEARGSGPIGSFGEGAGQNEIKLMGEMRKRRWFASTSILLRGACMRGGSAATHGSEFLIPTLPLAPSWSAALGPRYSFARLRTPEIDELCPNCWMGRNRDCPARSVQHGQRLGSADSRDPKPHHGRRWLSCGRREMSSRVFCAAIFHAWCTRTG